MIVTDLNLQRDNSSQATGCEESADVWFECATEGQVHAGSHGVLAPYDAAGLLLHGEGQALPTQQGGNVCYTILVVKRLFFVHVTSMLKCLPKQSCYLH